ncbi:hypothetical protein GCM10023219_25030 [Stakelama sediminis]
MAGAAGVFWASAACCSLANAQTNAGTSYPAPTVSAPAAHYPADAGSGPRGSSEAVPGEHRYDEVGYAISSQTAANFGNQAMYAASNTLPIGSFAEVTELGGGKTILIKVMAKGPASGSGLIDLSPAAADALGFAPGDSQPVRVRKVMPPAQERAVLNSGQAASARMDAPAALLRVLRKKLPSDHGSAVSTNTGIRTVPIPASVTPTLPGASGNSDHTDGSPSKVPPAKPALQSNSAEPATPKPSEKPRSATAAKSAPPASKPSPASKPANGALAPVLKGVSEMGGKDGTETKPAKSTPAVPQPRFYVQAATFSHVESANALAKKLDGFVVSGNGLHRVRMGPYADKAKADAARHKAVQLGFRDATILSTK